MDYPTAGGQHKKYNYAPLSAVIEACRKGLSDNGLAIMQPTKMVEDKLVVETLLAHSSGEWIKSEIMIMSQDKTPQGIGSALTYARRYALSALLGVASEEDDDGEKGGDDDKKKPKTEKPTEKATTETGDKPHWCTEHNTAFIEHTNPKGEHWWSHKQGDTYCNENKGKAKAEVVKPVIAPQSPETKKLIDEVYGEEPSPKVTGTNTEVDLTKLTFQDKGKFYTACHKHFKLLPEEVQKESAMYNLDNLEQRAKAWLAIVAVYSKKKDTSFNN